MANLLHERYGIGAIHDACASEGKRTRQNLIEGRLVLASIEFRPTSDVIDIVSPPKNALFKQLIFH